MAYRVLVTVARLADGSSVVERPLLVDFTNEGISAEAVAAKSKRSVLADILCSQLTS